MVVRTVNSVFGWFDNGARMARTEPNFPVATAEGSHLFPFRTEKLSPPAPMVLHGRLCGRVGRRRESLRRPFAKAEGLFHYTMEPACPAPISR
jgi:hypothetical protein